MQYLMHLVDQGHANGNTPAANLASDASQHRDNNTRLRAAPILGFALSGVSMA